jgi:hypothetical protein
MSYEPKEYTYLLGYEGWFWKFKEPSIEQDIEIDKILQKRFFLKENSFSARTGLDMSIACKQIAVTFLETNVPMHFADGPLIKPMTPVPDIEKFLLAEIHGDIGYSIEELVIELWKQVHHVRAGWGPIKKLYFIER